MKDHLVSETTSSSKCWCLEFIFIFTDICCIGIVIAEECWCNTDDGFDSDDLRRMMCYLWVWFVCRAAMLVTPKYDLFCQQSKIYHLNGKNGHLEWRVSSSVVMISCPRRQLHGLWSGKLLVFWMIVWWWSLYVGHWMIMIVLQQQVHVVYSGDAGSKPAHRLR